MPSVHESPLPDEPRRVSRSARAELYAIVFVTGAAVMTIEIIGTRVIGPIFGVSLFVWSALLAVTLGSLAIGYYAGGASVDRRPVPRLLGAVVLAAGLALGLVPLEAHFVLQLAETLGPRGGPLLGATLLFAPSCVLLGMVGPIAVRLGTESVRGAGRGVGSVYAISTAGSLVGTLATGFVLVPSFETREIISGTATLLALVGGASLAWHWKKAALVLSVLPLLSQTGQGSLPPGFRIVAQAQSLYGLVETIDDRARHARFLRADHSIIGAEYVVDHSSAFAFTHILESVHFIRPAAVDVLQIGLGAGSLPTALLRRGLRVDVVEIDPTVANFARLYFGFETRGDLYEEDARTFLRHTTRRYDVVVHDTFTGGTTPEHLLSLEVVRRIHEMLRPGGLLALNFAGYHEGPKAEASRSVMRTLRASFPRVQAFADSAPDEDPTGVSNIVFFASDDPLDFSVPEGARFENATCEASLRSFPHWEVLADVPDGPSITDEHNPLARLQIPIAEDHFRAMKELLPAEVWLR